MNVPPIDWSDVEQRRCWEKQNPEIVREWSNLSFTEKIKIIEEMENIVRDLHDGELPPSPDQKEDHATL